MTLAATLQEKLASWRPAGDGRHSWSEAFPDAGWVVRVTADRADTVGCLVWELTLARTADAPAGLTLKGWAERIAGRASGLLESLKVHEVDDLMGVAVLRSESPSSRGDSLAYYEVRLNGLVEATVRRFQVEKAPGARRDQVSFAVTHEVLAKLAGDIAD